MLHLVSVSWCVVVSNV